MRIEALDLIWIKMPLVGWFATSRGGIHERNILLVRAHAEGVTGWGEAGADWPPRYSYETVGTCWHIIEDFLAADTFAAELPEEGAAAALGRVLADWHWHPMARAAIEEAVWDLEARRRGMPLHRLYSEASETRGADGAAPRDRVEVGISLGIQPEFAVLEKQIDDALASGYRRIKLKIEDGHDVDLIRRVRDRFGDIPLMADANCGYEGRDVAPLLELDDMGLLMIEQPLGHDDLDGHAELQTRMKTPICLDEAASTVERTAEALHKEAGRIINIKCSRLGGRSNGIAVHDLCGRHDIPVWCGGMLESGVGRLHNIAIATLPGFSMANDLSASNRYWKEDIIEPAVELGHDGKVAVPSAPGIGYEVIEERVERHLVKRTTLTAP